MPGPDWMDHLSPVLMGLRASIREDSLTSPADLVFGALFRLPGAMFEPDSMVPPDLDKFVCSLRASLASLSPHPVLYHAKETGSMSRSLWSARAVFLRVDAVWCPLEPPYKGPFEVLHRCLNTFTISRGTKDVVVSVDHLKPAFPFAAPGPNPCPIRGLPPRSIPRSLAPLPTPETSKAALTTRHRHVSHPAVRFSVPQ